jgi:hypothetical protein
MIRNGYGCDIKDEPVIDAVYPSHCDFTVHNDSLTTLERFLVGNSSTELVRFCSLLLAFSELAHGDLELNIPRNGDTEDLIPPTPSPIRIRAPMSPPRPAPALTDTGSDVKKRRSSPER